jgi:hypothetical protein
VVHTVEQVYSTEAEYDHERYGDEDKDKPPPYDAYDRQGDQERDEVGVLQFPPWHGTDVARCWASVTPLDHLDANYRRSPGPDNLGSSSKNSRNMSAAPGRDSSYPPNRYTS